MTKLRAPGSVEQALDRIAGVIPWETMAQLAEREVSTVRNWSNPDLAGSIPFACAIRLDLAWQRAGGIGAPLRDAYDYILDAARAGEFGCQIELARANAHFSREFGEASHAATLATLPDSGDAEYAVAERELSHVAAALPALQAILRRLRRKPP